MFDASKITPQQSGGKHPIGNKFPFTITHTEKKPVGEGNTGKFLFAVTLTSPAGSIINNYNMWNPSATAVDIAAKQLSALCHAVGIFQVDIENGGKQLLNGIGLMDVDFQAGHGPTVEKPEGGYVEVKKVYDKNGNEPGKAVQQQQANNTGNSGAAWSGGNQANGGQQQQQTNNAAQANQGWQNQGGQQQQQTNNTGNAGGQTWAQGAAAEKPPWAS